MEVLTPKVTFEEKDERSENLEFQAERRANTASLRQQCLACSEKVWTLVRWERERMGTLARQGYCSARTLTYAVSVMGGRVGGLQARCSIMIYIFKSWPWPLWLAQTAVGQRQNLEMQLEGHCNSSRK